MRVAVKLAGVAVLFRRQKQGLGEINFVSTSGHSVTRPDKIYIDTRDILLSKYKHNLCIQKFGSNRFGTGSLNSNIP